MKSPPSYILGISAFYHDSAACLLRNGEIIAAAQEERFTRKKHDPDFPQAAVEYCFREAGITGKDLQAVAFYDKPWLKFERLLETYLNFAPAGLNSFLKAMPLWLKKKLWMEDYIRRRLEYEGPVYFPEHHQSHAASAFFPSPFQRAAIVTLDGVGEWTTTSWGIGTDNRIDLKAEMRFPHSLGLLYSAFTYFTGFKVNSGEYKVMGLAPYGEPKYVQTILDHVIDLREDGSFRLDMKYFNYCQGLTMTSPAFDELFGGPPRQPESPLTQREMDLARSVQEVTEEVMLRIVRHTRAETGERNLCLAGGVALNCVANGRILREGIFDDIWIQPAASDAGGALGAALFIWHQVQGNSRVVSAKGDSQRGSLLGPQFHTDEIASWADLHGYAYRRLGPDEVAPVTASMIADGKVIGWLQGRMEFGPRALGARSIIGDARNQAMQSQMNLKIKFRESFRPFAPSCAEEEVDEYFELDRPSPYMLLVAQVQERRRLSMTEEQQKLFGIDKLNIKRSDIPAVTHVDYSARIQTVSKDVNERYHQLLMEFKRLTGYSVIVNTSFNVRGEPIVCSPEDAYRCFMRTDIDALVMGDLVFDKAAQPKLSNDVDWRSQYELD